jgi:general stress protein 26
MARLGKNAKKIGELLENIDIAMLTTVGAGGFLMSRPLSTQQARFDGQRVWFFTEADSPKVAEIRRNPKVNLAYASKGRNTYVSLTGKASVNRDRARIDALWSDAMKAFFPNGKDDPNLVLLEVDVHSAEYWDGPGSVIGKVISFVIARVTRTEEVMGENRIVEMKGRRSSRVPPSNKAGGRSGAKAVAAAVSPGRKTAAGKRAAPARKSTATAKASAGRTAVARSASKTASGKTAGKKAPARKRVSGRAASR